MAASFLVSPPALGGAAALVPLTDPVAGPRPLLALLLFSTFVLHLLMMNALVGCTLLTLAERLFPARSGPFFTRSSDVLLPKGVAFAVNLGVPPFLFLQCLYGPYIYSSSILMGLWWLSVMLVVMLAYYGLYINMAGRGLSQGARHTALGLAAFLLLANAFLFVNNMTLLENPARWTAYAEQAGGTFLNLAEAQLIPRYLHVLLACLAVGGLCLALPAALRLRQGRNLARGEEEKALAARARGMKVFFHATLLQIPVGLWFFLSLPMEQRRIFMDGESFSTILFCAALLLTGVALFLSRRQRVFAVSATAFLTIVCMAGLRSLLRDSYLADIARPAMGAFDAGPFLLFAGSLAASGLFLVWMVRHYYRHSGGEEGQPLTPQNLEERRDALLINEVARTPEDDAQGKTHGKSREEEALP